MKPKPLILSVTGTARIDSAALPPLPSDLPTEMNGLPVTYAWKVMAAPGEYVHPQTGDRFTLTVDAFRQSEASHRALRELQGFTPFVPVKHSNDPTATDNLGHVIDVREHNGLLVGLHRLIGEDARAVAARNESSVYLHPEWRDQHGKTWPWVVEHNAILPNPVLTGLGGFVEVRPQAIAASRSGGSSSVRHFVGRPIERRPEMLKALADLYCEKVDGLVSAGRLNSRRAAAVKERFAPGGVPNPLALSRGPDKLANADAMIEEAIQQASLDDAAQNARRFACARSKREVTPQDRPRDPTSLDAARASAVAYAKRH